MSKRNFALSPREENVRDANPVAPLPLHFTLDEVKKHFDENLTELLTQFELADSLLEKGNISGCKGIWRSQVVFAEGLVDFYIHEISKYCLYLMFAGLTKKSDKYQSIRIPLMQVESACLANTLDERCEWFFAFINKHISRDVYLAADVMQDQLNLIGIPFEKVMNMAFPIEDKNKTVKNGKRIISEMFARRNEIAHQNDRSHATAVQNDISKEFVEDYISNVQKIVNAIHAIALSNEAEHPS